MLTHTGSSMEKEKLETIFIVLWKLWRRCLVPAFNEDENQVTFGNRKWRVIGYFRIGRCSELRSWYTPLLKHKNWELLYFLSAEIFLEKDIICRGRSGRGELTNVWSQVFLISRKAKPTSGWRRYSGMNGITIDIDITANVELHKCLNLQALYYLKVLEVKCSQILLLLLSEYTKLSDCNLRYQQELNIFFKGCCEDQYRSFILFSFSDDEGSYTSV